MTSIKVRFQEMFGVQDKPPKKGSPLFTGVILILSPWFMGALGLALLFAVPSAIEMVLIDPKPVPLIDQWVSLETTSLIIGGVTALISLYMMWMGYFMWKQAGHWGYWTVIKDHTLKIQEDWERRQNG